MEFEKYLTFDPIQLKEFGMDYYLDTFEFRYKKYKRAIFLDGIYIPNGPITKNLAQIDDFLKYLRSEKMVKVKLDLPLLLAEGLKEKVVNELKSIGFTESNYLQDNETLFINLENEKINNKEVRYYTRKAENTHEFKVVTQPSDEIINEIYEVYLVASSFQGYKPKMKAAFARMAKAASVGLAINKSSQKIDGFVWGYTYYLAKDLECKNYYKIMDTVFIGTNESGRQSYVGYGMHKELFNFALNELKVDFINFEGASRNQNRKYLSFKKSFGGEFYPLGGSYEKVFWL